MDASNSHAEWAESLTNDELAATLEHHARLAARDATFYITAEAARRLRAEGE